MHGLLLSNSNLNRVLATNYQDKSLRSIMGLKSQINHLVSISLCF